jgi:hypothetical protein
VSSAVFCSSSRVRIVNVAAGRLPLPKKSKIKEGRKGEKREKRNKERRRKGR